MRVEAVADGRRVTVLRDLSDERSVQLAAVLDQLCDAGVSTVLDLTGAAPPSTMDWLHIERCRRRFARRHVSLRLITGGEGLTDERRQAQAWLTTLTEGPGQL